MKTNHVRILLVEDNPDDAELAARELEHEGFRVEWSRAETEDVFRDALAQKPDLILSDYALPTFDGMTALRIQQELAPEIPLIIISGAVGEEIAVECMKSGATDYVMKDKLSRLGPVLKRALEEAEMYRERNRATDELKRRNEELSAFNKIAVDRELRMVELKKEVNSLLDELGREARYEAPD